MISGKPRDPDTGGATGATSDFNVGHRRRLLDRYMKNGSDALHPYELLELLLTFSIHRRDTKQIAHALLRRFKTVNAVCTTPKDILQEIDGIGEKSAILLKLVHDIAAAALKERYERNNVLTHRQEVEAYLRFCYGNRRDEYVAVLFLDTGNHVIQTEIVAEGTVNQCVLYPRTILKRALEVHAAAFILAHNHPAGTPNPSEGDWLITRRLHEAGRLLEITLLDHIIVCSDEVVSLREMERWPH
jgi:DNA repair protein RadC